MKPAHCDRDPNHGDRKHRYPQFVHAHKMSPPAPPIPPKAECPLTRGASRQKLSGVHGEAGFDTLRRSSGHRSRLRRPLSQRRDSLALRFYRSHGHSSPVAEWPAPRHTMVAGCIEATRHEGPWPAGAHGGVGLRPRGKPATRQGGNTPARAKKADCKSTDGDNPHKGAPPEWAKTLRLRSEHRPTGPEGRGGLVPPEGWDSTRSRRGKQNLSSAAMGP